MRIRWRGKLAGRVSVRFLHAIRHEGSSSELRFGLSAGVAIRGPQGWLFYAADAYFYHAEMDIDAPRCTPGLRLYQRMMEKERPSRLLNQSRLRDLKRNHADVTLFCAHDVREFEGLTGRSARTPLAAPSGWSASAMPT